MWGERWGSCDSRTAGLLPRKSPPSKVWCLAPRVALDMVQVGGTLGSLRASAYAGLCSPCAEWLKHRLPSSACDPETEAGEDKLQHKRSSQVAEGTLCDAHRSAIQGSGARAQVRAQVRPGRLGWPLAPGRRKESCEAQKVAGALGTVLLSSSEDGTSGTDPDGAPGMLTIPPFCFC